MNYRRLFCRIILLSLFVLASLTILFSCKKKEEAPAPVSARLYEKRAGTGDAAPAAAPAAPEQEESDAADAPDESSTAAPQKDSKRKVIMSHELSLKVKSLSAAIASLTKLAETSGGYVYESTRNSNDNRSYYGTIGIRVPTGKAGGVLAAIRGMGMVESESSKADDITDDYVDMEARLKNAQASEARLKEMYQRAGTIKDVLAVEKELTRVRGDIEAFVAKKRNWDLLIEMTTIEVNLREPSAVMPASHSFWEPIRSAFGISVEFFANSVRALIIFLGMIAPWLIVIVPAYFLLVRQLRRRRERKSNGAQ